MNAVRGIFMKSLVSYVKEVRSAYEKYTNDNGIDNLAEKVYESIQNIESLSGDEKAILDEFIADYGSQEKHLADVVYVNKGGEASTFKSLSRMRPIKLSKTDGRVYEARDNSFSFVLGNNKRKSIKVYQRKPIK